MVGLVLCPQKELGTVCPWVRSCRLVQARTETVHATAKYPPFENREGWGSLIRVTQSVGQPASRNPYTLSLSFRRPSGPRNLHSPYKLQIPLCASGCAGMLARNDKHRGCERDSARGGRRVVVPTAENPYTLSLSSTAKYSGFLPRNANPCEFFGYSRSHSRKTRIK